MNDRDYLYHCGGCGKADKNYPGELEDCDECLGSGLENSEEKTDNDCWTCGGRGNYIRRYISIEYHEWARNDAYGLYTGLYCHKCYDDPSKYTYRKDRYYDPAYAGERMEEDY